MGYRPTKSVTRCVPLNAKNIPAIQPAIWLEIESILRALGMIPEQPPVRVQAKPDDDDDGSDDEVQRLSSALRSSNLRDPKPGTGTVNAKASKIRGRSRPTIEDDDSDFDL
jgi:hypothetical protein